MCGLIILDLQFIDWGSNKRAFLVATETYVPSLEYHDVRINIRIEIFPDRITAFFDLLW